MKKARNEYLIPLAEKALRANSVILNGNAILSAYNPKITSLGISIGMSGLQPSLAIFKNNENRSEVDTIAILDVIAKILHYDQECPYRNRIEDNDSLWKVAIHSDTDVRLLKRYVKEAAIALKQVVRTYELI